MKQHWNEDDFKQWLYSLKEADHHLEECPDCRSERDRLRMIRAGTMEQPEISSEFLAAQRRSIYRRFHEPNRFTLRWALPVAMVLLMAFGLTLQRSRRSVPAISDEQLFSDLNAIEQSAEPKAIAPMHKLFEE
jgi:hypothetical protein